MRQLLVLAAVAGLALARPETYREKEDFQFSRSSSDEGSKSGFYGAQRGNMGGNYERSHNMDNLAQNQMSGLVKTVEGELGEGASQQTGSVYSAANSRGVYGSGHYDLSNLQGRNFQEGVSFQDSQSHSSLTSNHGSAYKGHLGNTGYGTSISQNAGYSGLSQHQRTGYGTSQSQLATAQIPVYGVGHTQNTGYSSQSNSRHGYTSGQLYSTNQDLQSASQHEDRTAQNSAYDSGYYAQAAGYQGQSYDQSSSHALDGSNIRTRLVSATPVRVVIRPGSQVIVPVAAQTYDASQSAASFDQSAINKDTEVFRGTDQQVVSKPTTKHHQSTYSYRKEWERHDTQPVSGVVPLSIPALPTVNPYPANSELNEDTQSQSAGSASQSHHSSHSGYSANSALSSQSRYNTHQSSAAADQSQYRTGYNGVAYGAGNGATAGLTQVDDLSNKPKGYQSSYSYHKSWERQGDPYVIEPVSNHLQDTSGKLVSANHASDSSHQYGSHHHSHQSYSANCDVCRYRREASPYNNHQTQEHLSQHSQNLEELGQQSQSTWDQIPSLGQQVQPSWDGQQTEDKWERIEDLGQQTVSQWDQRDLGQQTQNTWGNLETQSQTDLGQQTQETWGTLDNKPNGNDEGRDHVGMDIVHQLDNPFDISQSTSQIQAVTTESSKTSTHHHTIWDEIKKEEIGQETEDTVEDLTQIADKGQQTQDSWGNINQNENSPWQTEDKVLIHMSNRPSQPVSYDLPNPHPLMYNQVNHENSPWQTEDKVLIYMTNRPNQPDSYDMPNPHPWMYNQEHHHNMMNHFFSHDSSSYSGSHSHSWQEHSTNMNANGQGAGSSVMSFWDKLDNIEKETIPSHGKDDIGNYGAQGVTTNIFGTQAHQNTFESHQNNNKHISAIEDTYNTHKNATAEDSRITTDSPKTEHKPLQNVTIIKPEQTTTSPRTVKPSTEPNNNVQPLDVDRGDIGPEDTPIELIESQPSKHNEQDKNNTHEVTQENRDENIGLSVLSLDQQQAEKDKVVTDAPTEIITQQHMHNENSFSVLESRDRDRDQFEDQGQHNYDQETTFHQVDDQLNHHENTDQQFVDFGQQNVNIGAEQMEQQFVIESLSHNNAQETQNHVGESLGQHNVPFVDFGQKNENIGGEQVEQQFETQNFEPIESLHQQNKTHSVEELGNSDDQIDKVSLSGWKADQDSVEDLTQQNKQEDQVSYSGWKPEQPSTVDLGQQNEQVDQISLSGWKADKPTAVGDQQHEQFDQVSGWRDESSNQQEHKLQNRRQQENLEQQSQSGWSEDMESQMAQAAWMPTEDLQQHSQSFGEHAWAQDDQQVQTAWKPTEDLQQSHVPNTFVQMDQVNPSSENAQVVEEIIVPKKVAAVDSPPEPTTEKPGFWKSVGSKFTSAKDKVASWFSKDHS